MDVLFSYTLRNVALGTAILGIVSGALGSFALLRRQSLLGDAISHAALPGVVLAFIITGNRSSWVLLLGAAISGWLSTIVYTSVVRNTRIKSDGALGMSLSVFFGIGLMLLVWVQRNMAGSQQAGLDRFLFGQAAALVQRDVITIAVAGGFALIALLIFWKEMKLISFDTQFAESIGYPVRRLEMLLTTLLVIAIVIGLQAVGVILMSAMVVAPAAASRQWTDKLGVMVGLAAFFGAVSGVTGALISNSLEGLSTGPVIVLVVSCIAFLSLIFAPNRGLFWRGIQRQSNRRQLRYDMVLTDLYLLEEEHEGDASEGHSEEMLRLMNLKRGGVAVTLTVLKEQGLVSEVSQRHWKLTEAGKTEAFGLLNTNPQDEI